MALARCPICEDILTIGINVKLHQALVCPTCLSSLQVVGLSPLELEVPLKRSGSPGRGRNRHTTKQGDKKGGRAPATNSMFEQDDYEDEGLFDDYQLERILRHKSDRSKRQKASD